MNMNELMQELNEMGFDFTTNPYECIYILPNGEMLDGGFDCGYRGIDHNMIDCIVPYDRYDNHIEFWNYVHDILNLVRVVPECGSCLIGVNQELTQEQINIISEIDFEIERY